MSCVERYCKFLHIIENLTHIRQVLPEFEQRLQKEWGTSRNIQISWNFVQGNCCTGIFFLEVNLNVKNHAHSCVLG